MMQTEIVRYEGADKLKSEIEPVVQEATAIVVRDQETRDGAMVFLKNVKAAKAKVKAFFAPIKMAAHEAWKRTTAGEGMLLAPLDSAEKAVKDKVLAFDSAAEERRGAEELRLQAEADARAEKERQRLLKEAEKLKTPELKAARLEAAVAVVAPVVHVEAEVSRGTGESTRGRWKAELVDIAALAEAACAGDRLAMSLLAFNQVAANRQATATKNSVPIPGVRFFREVSLAVNAE